MARLSKRVAKLEQRVNLLVSIADFETYPVICTCLEADMDADQIDKVVEIINKAEHSLNTKKPMSYSQFEKSILEIVPTQKSNPEFVKNLIRAMAKRDKFYRGYEHFKKEGVDL